MTPSPAVASVGAGGVQPHVGLAVCRGVVSEVMVGVGVAGQGPVGGAPGLEAAGAPGWAGAPMSSHLGGGAATAPRAPHSAGARGGAHPAVTVPGAHAGLAAAAAVSDVIINPRVTRSG